MAHDPERTAVVPRFDESEVGRARPAVPFEEIGVTARGARRKPRPLLVAAVVAGLAGGILGGVGTAVYQRYQSAPAASAAQNLPARDETASATSDDAGPQTDETQTTAETENPASSATDDAARAGESETVEAATEEARAGATGDAHAQLSAALAEWVAATNARDINRQMNLYDSRLGAFYLARGASREAVRAEKRRVFERASAVDVSASGPAIRLSPDGRTAVMRFRKRYAIEGAGVGRRGEVVQELRWRRTPGGWKIVSERDLRVIN